MQDNSSDQEILQGPFPVPPRQQTRVSKWTALGVGCLIAAIGIPMLVASVSSFDDFAIRARFVLREERVPRRLSDAPARQHGFGYGLAAFLGMGFASLGLTVAAAPFLGATGRRRLAVVLAVCWHGLGAYACWCYVSLAPRPYDTWPFLAVGIYEWFGLIPLAIAVPEAALAGRLRSATWNLWGGSFLGAAFGALVGFVVGGVWLFLPHEAGSGHVGYDGWMYGALAGGIAVGAAFFTWQLLNLSASNEGNRRRDMQKRTGLKAIWVLTVSMLVWLSTLHAGEETAPQNIDRETVEEWSAPYRGWHYQPEYVIPAQPKIPGCEKFHSTDAPCVYQLPGQPDKWFMSFIAFNGQGYNSFVAKSTDLVRWTNPRLAMGFGPPNEFDHGGCVIGAFLYESYDIKAPRFLKKRDGKYWTLYGCYPRQGGYELRPGYEGVACSDDGLVWRRAKNTPILAVQDADCGTWEKDCIYQPWLVEHGGRFFDFYNAANGGIEQTGLAFSTDLLTWKRHAANPVIRNRRGGYDAQFCSDPKVFRDGDHWTMFYFGVGHGGAHVMAAFSRDLEHWTAHPEPLYKAGGNPSGLDKQYAHKISLVYNPQNATFYLYYCACGGQGRGIALITSKPLAR